MKLCEVESNGEMILREEVRCIRHHSGDTHVQTGRQDVDRVTADLLLSHHELALVVTLTRLAVAAAGGGHSLSCLSSQTWLLSVIIIIALKGANRDFYNLLITPRTVFGMYAQVARAQPCANHVQHVERLSRVTCSVPLGTKKQLGY